MKNEMLVTCTAVAISLCSCSNSHSGGSGSYSPQNTDSMKPALMTSDLSRGQEIFQQRCQACHGISGNYRNNNAANLQWNKTDSITIINTIKNGKGAMPMFGTVIPDSDLAQVEMYVKSLRRS